MKILAVGDIVGSAGVNELKLRLKEIKEKENINFYSYKKYIFLDLKESYYYIPKDELTISIDELMRRLREGLLKYITSSSMILYQINMNLRQLVA